MFLATRKWELMLRIDCTGEGVGFSSLLVGALVDEAGPF